MSAPGSRMVGPSKVKKGKGKGRGRTSLDPLVKSIKERFEAAGEAKGSQVESVQRPGQDPDLGLDPGKEK